MSCSRSAANRDLWDWEKGKNDSFMSVTFTPLAPPQNAKSSGGEGQSASNLDKKKERKSFLPEFLYVSANSFPPDVSSYLPFEYKNSSAIVQHLDSGQLLGIL